MHIVYIDESGFALDWQASIQDQPFYVLAAIAIPVTNLRTMYENVRQGLNDLDLPGINARLIGLGEEMKAKDLDSGSGYWRGHEEHRGAVRDLMLSVPKSCSGCAFLIIVDKAKHLRKYTSPDEPDTLALKFLFERIQAFLEEKDSFAICIFDRNKREQALLTAAKNLILDGSFVSYWSPFYKTYIERILPLERILEFHTEDSRYSLGLQVADFYARISYSWRKNGKKADYPGWALIREQLYTRGSRVTGWGYKEFPEGGLDDEFGF